MPSRHTLRQLKFIVPGGLICLYLGIHEEFWQIVGSVERSPAGWGRTAAISSLGLGITTIALFMYVLLTPWIQGVEPNYQSWRDSGLLSAVIPALTASIVVGWSLLAITLGHYSGLGYLKGIAGAGAVYALTFGLMGLIPAPRVRRR